VPGRYTASRLRNAAHSRRVGLPFSIQVGRSADGLRNSSPARGQPSFSGTQQAAAPSTVGKRSIRPAPLVPVAALRGRSIVCNSSRRPTGCGHSTCPQRRAIGALAVAPLAVGEPPVGEKGLWRPRRGHSFLSQCARHRLSNAALMPYVREHSIGRLCWPRRESAKVPSASRERWLRAVPQSQEVVDRRHLRSFRSFRQDPSQLQGASRAGSQSHLSREVHRTAPPAHSTFVLPACASRC
jgi:hypothetical protein